MRLDLSTLLSYPTDIIEANFYTVGWDDETLTISSCRVSQAFYHAVYHPVSYPNAVLFPNDPSSAVAHGVVYDGVPFCGPCNPPYNAEAISTGGMAVFCHNSPTVRHNLWTSTNSLYTDGTNSRDRKRFRRQHLGDSRHTFLVLQPPEVEQG